MTKMARNISVAGVSQGTHPLPPQGGGCPATTPARWTDPISAGTVAYPPRDGSRAKRWCMLAPWCPGRPAGPRKPGAGLGDRAGLFRSQGSFIQNSASVVRWGRDSRIEQPSPISQRGPLFREISSPALLSLQIIIHYKVPVISRKRTDFGKVGG